MIKRLLLNWVNTETGTAAIRRQLELAINVRTHETEATTVIWDMTFSWTECADNGVAFCMPPSGFHGHQQSLVLV